MPSRPFYMKFDAEKLLFEAFFGIMRIFGSVYPKSECNFPFLCQNIKHIIIHHLSWLENASCLYLYNSRALIAVPITLLILFSQRLRKTDSAHHSTQSTGCRSIKVILHRAAARLCSHVGLKRVRHRKITPPTTIFLGFWPLPSQFTSATSNFYLGGIQYQWHRGPME